MAHIYPAIFEPNDDGTYTIWFPDMPSCISEGKTLENALYMAREALVTWIDNLERKAQPIPPASAVASVAIEGHQFVTLVDCNVDEYRRKMLSSPVRRTISLPQYLDDMASSAHISLSAFVQDALKDHFRVSGQCENRNTGGIQK